jgi:hypothetical protein
VLSALDVTLGIAALLIGLTGAWSPCGFSMVETIGISGRAGTGRVTAAACVTFTLGAVVGGAATFGALAGLGAVIHGAGGDAAYLVAAAIALIAAAAEARGVRIAPQIRRQLPEGWRWTMPLPLAAALYGVLLGLGFTTFVLTFGVWALAGISFAVGDPVSGLIVGIAFGIGRAIPVVVVAPMVDRPLGARCISLMAERPALYRGFRVGDAMTLLAVAVALTTTAAATAANTVVHKGADPSSAGRALAFQRPDRSGVLRTHGSFTQLPGNDPAVGGPYFAVIAGGRTEIHILDRSSLDVLGVAPADGAQAVAVSQGWLAYLTIQKGRYALRARRIHNPANPGPPRLMDSVGRPSQIGHPGLDGGTLVYPVATRDRNAIVKRNIRSGRKKTLLHTSSFGIESPSLLGDHLLYVRIERARESPQATYVPPLIQRLLLTRVGHGGGHTIYSQRNDGQIWSTSLTRHRAFFTLLSGGKEKILVTSR